LPKLKAKSRRGTQTYVTSASDKHTRLSKEITYETPKREPVLQYDDDYDNEFLEEDSKTLGRENVSPVAGPYLIPYVCKRRFLDTQYGKPKDGYIFKIGVSRLRRLNFGVPKG
jgi:hypothetical protein